jgi:hypothetical protein
MSNYSCPPQRRSSEGFYFENLVGLQVVQGGGLTQGNFQVTTTVNEKSDRFFDTGIFSGPITLNNLNISSVAQAQKINDVNFKVYPNFDQTDVLNFVAYGPLSKRFSAAVLNIINYFPASIESSFIRQDYSTGNTAFDILYDSEENVTYLSLNAQTLKNPFNIDFTINASRNINSLGYDVSKYRNFNSLFTSYSLFTPNDSYRIIDVTGTTSISAGTLYIMVKGNVFSGATTTLDTLVIRPNDYTVNEVFNLELDEVEELLLNRFSYPIYTSKFQVLTEGDDGNDFIKLQTLTWPLDGVWNIDIRTNQFTNYLQKLEQLGRQFDEYETDLVSRFYTTESLKEFDTIDQKAQKTFKIYGRSFDETKKYADSISHMVSVNYNVGNDIPSKLLVNLAGTLGWDTNISPIQSDSFLSTLYETSESQFPGMSNSMPTDEIEYQYYRNLILNSAYLFKSKGTRKAIEFLMSNIGAPEALVEFNEYVYTVGGKILISRFEQLYSSITGGTFTSQLPVLDPNNVYRFNGAPYTAYTISTSSIDVTYTRSDYPIDSEGYPSPPTNNDGFYFQKGEGWYESTPQHRSPEILDLSTAVVTGNSPSIQTSLEPFSYGEKYLDRFRNFPLLGAGFGLQKTIDNKKSWVDTQDILRKNSDGNYDAFYKVSEEKLVMNAKNVDLFLNPAQALVYDVWYLSQTQDYPIPYSGLTATFTPTDVDNTIIDPKPQVKDFFEFKESFWKNMINVRNRQISSDGKTGGYPFLQNIFYSYLESEQNAGIENNGFSYSKMIEYVNGIGNFWVKLVEQFIPATTLWNTGTRIENSIFHRQKFSYRMQRGCLPLDVQILGPQVLGGFAPQGCPASLMSTPLQYDSNLIQSNLGTLSKTINCKGLESTVQNLNYAFEIIVIKNGVTYTFNYTDPQTYIYPSQVIKQAQWDTFITQGLGYLMNEFISAGLTASYELNELIMTSEDCLVIESIDFNLEYKNVNFTCV